MEIVQRQIIAGFEAYTIISEDGLTRATFLPERGGVASSIVMPGHSGPRELLFHYSHLWDRQSTLSPGGLSFCFPICGGLERHGQLDEYYYEGHLYPLSVHGFAWHKLWMVADAGSNHLLLMLRDDAETRLVYPFHFTVELRYEVANRRLFCRQIYTNHGDTPMPYYAGFYPHFLTPAPGQGKDRVTLNCHPERRMRYNRHLTDLVGEQPLFAFPVSVARAEIHEQLLKLGEDKNIHLSYPDKDVINMVTEGVEDPELFPYLQIESPQDQPFVAVAPWMAYPNALNSVAGVRWLAPGKSEHGVFRLWME